MHRAQLVPIVVVLPLITGELDPLGGSAER
jgi:hypothetical protein